MAEFKAVRCQFYFYAPPIWRAVLSCKNSVTNLFFELCKVLKHILKTMVSILDIFITTELGDPHIIHWVTFHTSSCSRVCHVTSLLLPIFVWICHAIWELQVPDVPPPPQFLPFSSYCIFFSAFKQIAGHSHFCIIIEATDSNLT